jgi:hypothetical protein
MTARIPIVSLRGEVINTNRRSLVCMVPNDEYGCEDFVVDSKEFSHMKYYQVRAVLTFHGNIYAFLCRKADGSLLSQGLIRSGITTDKLQMYTEWQHYVDWYKEQIKSL